MNIDALKVFAHEYQLRFPIAVDRPSESHVIPVTMQKFSLEGTPSLIIVDKKGQMRVNHFGRMSDMELGYLIGLLLHEESGNIVNNKNGSDGRAKLTVPSSDNG
ncbi:MAG: TlpA family protein disulfide reductase [Gammaproteobacteria bacterium]